MEYRKATVEELEVLWDKNIAENADDSRWLRWKTEFIENNISGRATTFIVVTESGVVGEGTILFSSQCRAVAGRELLCNDRDTANINALRIRKEYEGQGHISRLIKEMEKYARENGITHLTIGVEARETRTLAIYLHLGFSKFLFSESEDGELILYFRKEL